MSAQHGLTTRSWLIVLLALPIAPALRAQPSDPPATAPVDSRVAHLHALCAGTLPAEIDPASLFEVPLDDEAAIRVEVARLRRALQQASDPTPAPLDAGAEQRWWQARAALDRARLAFYELSAERRSALLSEHEARRGDVRPSESEAEQRAQQAELERQRTLDAARTVRTEAERAVAEEHAQLLALQAQLDRLSAEREHAQQKLRLIREEILGWQRRSREAKVAGAAVCDETYDALRIALRAARSELDGALDALSNEGGQIADLPVSALAQVPSDVVTEHVQTLRSHLAKQIEEARTGEHALHRERAATLLDQVSALNRERLALLGHLSGQKRDATTGFTEIGWDQAQAEARHLTLVLRYERHVTADLVTAWRGGDSTRLRPSIWTVLFLVVPWCALVGAFFWSHRRSLVLLRLAEKRQAAADRAERRTTPSPQLRAIRLLVELRLPIEWALFFAGSMWLLPQRAHGLLEVQLLSTILMWIIGMSFVVNATNALAGSGRGAAWQDEDSELSTLRLRSLKLVGRTVVVFALILMLSERLVGEGTIYSWTRSTCWFASLPVFVALVRWWRSVVFDRVERIRKKSPLQSWALSQRSGWPSFIAAMLMATQLFATGTWKVLRGRLSGFDLTRRAHAYMFTRELERLSGPHGDATRAPLPDATLRALDPEAAYSTWLRCANDELLAELAECASSRRGGLRALVAARGMGKTSLLRALGERVPSTIMVTCDSDSSAQTVKRRVEEAPFEVSAVLLDGAHLLAKPVIGGFARFDEMIAMARESCHQTLWVCALDATLWPLLKRARDTRPLFDSTHLLAPWDETQIGALLADRDARAGIQPRYDDLLDKLPPGSDEIDRQDALHAKQAGYERMLWDHVRGNPALALQAWRSSLVRDERQLVHVRPLQVPDASALERLPDPTLFVLRAVLQLGPAGVDDVAQATRLSVEQVWNALRYGQALGVFSEREGRVLVSWPWLRAVTRLLERRHLLVAS